MAADPGQVSGSSLQTNFRATTSGLPTTFKRQSMEIYCSTNVPYIKVVGRNSCLFEAFFIGACFRVKCCLNNSEKFFRSQANFLPL